MVMFVLTLEPLGAGAFVFEDATKGGVVPREYIPSVEKGLTRSDRHRRAGGLSGGRCQRTLTFGSYHDVDSSEIPRRWRIFGSGGAQSRSGDSRTGDACGVERRKSTPGNIMGDLSSRRGGAGDGRAIRQPDYPRGRSRIGRKCLLFHWTLRLDVAGTSDRYGVHHYAEAPAQRGRHDYRQPLKG